MMKTQNWFENTFSPWKKMAEENLSKQKMFEQNLQESASEVKYIVSLLLENKGEEAVRLWNELGLDPMLEHVELDMRTDTLIMKPKNDVAFELRLGTMIRELQRLFS